VPTDKHTLLICTVGGSPEPLIKSLLHWRPARVLFVPSQQTVSHVDAVLRGYAEHAGQPLGPGMYDRKVVSDAEELDECLRVMRGLEQEVLGWLSRGGDYQVVADFTAGTKCMTAALALQARRWPCRYSYVGGAQRSKEGVGIVESGSERVVHSANPWDALGFQAAEDFVTLFDQQAFAAAATLMEEAKRYVGDASRKRELNALQLLAQTYDAWDRFDHKQASAKVKDLLKYENDLQAVIGPARGDELRSVLHKHSDYLTKLAGEGTTQRSEHVIDLLANAKRRHTQGRIDDAVARLYRAIESLAQSVLAERHQIQNTGKVLLNSLPESLRAQWEPRAENGMLLLGLQDAYALLDALGDPLGARFKELQLHDRDRSPLSARNQSILAHGFQPVSETVFDRLWQSAMKLGEGVFAESDLPAFPRLD
jgi:CRISPR-associated protein (TIGR02710 family)